MRIKINISSFQSFILMRTTKSDFFPLIIIVIFIFMVLTSCTVTKPVEPSVNLINGMFTDMYEDPKGLHLALSDTSEILVELQDEQELYYFEFSDSEHEIRYFREGNAAQGCTGVFVVLSNELYRIDSHHNRIK